MKLQTAYKLARQKLDQKAAARKLFYDQKVTQKDLYFKGGAQVYKKDRTVRGRKIQDTYMYSPVKYKVLQCNHEQNVYLIEPVHNFGKSKWIHRNELRACPTVKYESVSSVKSNGKSRKPLK